ncbi:MAG: sulfotransferase [Pseudomonadota bacterium]
MSRRTTIDLFFVGPGRCGTTWLYETLSHWPGIAVPHLKETGIFLDRDPDVEKQALKLWRSEGLKADFSNTYCADADVAARIQAHNPHAKIIFTVRAPLTRALSHFGFLKRNGQIPPKTQLDAYLAGGDSWQILERCDYAQLMAPFEARFPKEQILILAYEDLQKDPNGYLSRLRGFLGLKPLPPNAPIPGPVLAQQAPRGIALARLAKRTALLLRACRAVRLLGWLKRQAWLQYVLFVPAKGANEPVENQALNLLQRGYPELLKRVRA